MGKFGMAPFMGMEKEPPPQNGLKVGGSAPLVHSHSMMPKRKIVPSKRRGHKR